MRYLRVSLEYTGHFQVPSKDGGAINVEGTGRIWYGDWPNTTDIMIEPGGTYSYPIEFRIQFGTPEIPGASVSEWTCNLPVTLPAGALVPEATGS